MTTLLTRREIKRQAKEKLRTNDNWRQLMIANVIPWLIAVVVTILALLEAHAILSQIDYNNVVDSLNNLPQNGSRSLIESLVATMFGQGIAFTALETWRNPDQAIKPWTAVFRVFNGRWFWGVLAVWFLSTVFQQLGFILFIIPGILLYYGLSQSYYALYDARKDGQSSTALSALVQSWRLMSGFKLDLFVLGLSLLGWIILQNITLHLLDFAINPYLQLVYAGFYENVRNYQAQQQVQG
ncbi:DUF975 family protein [Lacticaseibacillus brantae]|uniref:Integral membrane protein n=1 Tax=Lacticaseibacillus brantae DSM 23927 TaxID=1423727 RepID=A0A0R2AVY2_9LACO|nr:DUF975 family protein [Lacticaseibacillus brantae]KRM71598.1 integral membrane protein [Lacticaseibacillus brantae DSM 23927]